MFFSSITESLLKILKWGILLQIYQISDYIVYYLCIIFAKLEPEYHACYNDIFFEGSKW